jgi:phospholipase/lecithinase/hemolysin
VFGSAPWHEDTAKPLLYDSGMAVNSRLCILLALAGTILLRTVQAGPIDAIYSFGDSLSDVGNIYATTGDTVPGAPYFNGQFSNGNVWVQDLASDLGLAALTPSRLGGTDYAYGTGETGVTTFNTSAAATDLLGGAGQLAQFQSANATADPNALYTIWIGSNDLNDILANAMPSQYGADIGTVAGNIDTAIGILAAMGAKNFLVVTVPDLGLTPDALALGPAASAGASEISASFDSTLVSGAGPIPSLATVAVGDSINISVLNTFALLDTIVSDPTAYGFTNVTSPCYTGTYAGFADTMDPGTECPTPDQYLFFDGEHPTAAGHALVADAALSLVTPEPGSISLIAAGLLGLVALRRRYCGAGYR